MLNRLIKIDELILSQHHNLDISDECYFFGEYLAGGTLECRENPINSLIANIKKCVSKKDQDHYRYKNLSIQRIANALRDGNLNDFVVIPVPPSKSKNDPLYDDRLVRILESANIGFSELIWQTESRTALHAESNVRPNPEIFQENYEFDELAIKNIQKPVVIFDDVITTGTHYKAIKNLLLSINPHLKIFGVFVARRVPSNTNDLSFTL